MHKKEKKSLNNSSSSLSLKKERRERENCLYPHRLKRKKETLITLFTIPNLFSCVVIVFYSPREKCATERFYKREQGRFVIYKKFYALTWDKNFEHFSSNTTVPFYIFEKWVDIVQKNHLPNGIWLNLAVWQV